MGGRPKNGRVANRGKAPMGARGTPPPGAAASSGTQTGVVSGGLPDLTTSRPHDSPKVLSGSFESAVRGRLQRGGIKALASQKAHRDQVSLESLISQAQQLHRNNPIARAIAGGKQALLVGDGPTLTMRSPDPDWNRMVEDRYWTWNQRQAVPDGQRTFDQLLAAVPVQWLTDGAALFYKLAATGKAPAMIQPISVARLVSPTRDDERTRGGITTDDFGRPVTYHVAPWSQFGHLDRAKIADLPAADFIHCASPRNYMPEQMRAEPGFACVQETLEWLYEAGQAVRTAFLLAAEIALFVKSADASLNLRQMIAQGVVGAGEAANTDEAIAGGEWRRGQVLQGRTGEEIDQIKSEHPNTPYTQYHREIMRDVCAACGVPMSVCIYLFDKSYSAARAELAIAERHMRMERTALDRLATASLEHWLAWEIKSGRIEAVAGWRQHTWQWPAVPVLDPKIEIEARAAQLAANLTTRERALTDLGITDGIDAFWDARGREIEIEKERGITTALPSQVSRTVMQEGTGD